MMNIVKMAINGFGKLNGVQLELRSPLTVLYGANEAGKSTIMGFIRAMLFGFPTRAHMKERYEPQRGGEHGGLMVFKDEQGQSYVLERYEGSRGAQRHMPRFQLTLEDGTLATEQHLTELLGGINADVFKNVFAFSLTELQQLSTLQSEEVSGYLYRIGAGSGARAIIEAEKKLSQHMDELFRPRGKVQPINVLVEQLDQLSEQLANDGQQVQMYNEKTAQLHNLDVAIVQSEERLKAETDHLNWLDICVKVHEDWTLLQSYKRELPQRQPLAPQQHRSKRHIFVWGTFIANGVLPLLFLWLNQWELAGISLAILALFNVFTTLQYRRQRREQAEQAAASAMRAKAVQEEMAQLELYLQAKVGVERREALDELLRTVTYDDLRKQLANQQMSVQAMRGELNELNIEKGRVQAEMAQLVQSGQRYDQLRQQREQLEADLEHYVEQWASAAICATLLKHVKESYEREKQPHVLQRASRYLAMMTDDRYVQVMAPLGERTIRVQHHAGEVIDAEFLSRGTAEQLYLAMRFALADEYAKQVALPLVMDDIFVNFDPVRMKATMNVLAEMSERHQLIVMTCHPHIRDLLINAVADAQLIELTRISS